jgi:hypothetical protein
MESQVVGLVAATVTKPGLLLQITLPSESNHSMIVGVMAEKAMTL